MRNIRISGKKQAFIELGYGDQQIQVVVLGVDLVSYVKEISVQSYIECGGLLQSLPPGKKSSMPFELQADSLKVVSLSDSDYEHQCPPEAGPEIKLEKRHLYFRDPRFALILRAHAALLKALRYHFDETGCTEITPPCFTGVECEGGARLRTSMGILLRSCCHCGIVADLCVDSMSEALSDQKNEKKYCALNHGSNR